MYQWLLCTRYLRTRYLAFVCIVSVMLGVATLIVVNSVMSGFSNKLKDRLHGILSDVMIETDRPDGFAESPDALMARIHASPVGQYVEAASPTVEVVAMLQYHVIDRNTMQKIPIIKHVKLLGIDPAKHAQVGRFGDYLKNQKGAAVPTFDLTPEAKERQAWNHTFGGWSAPVQPAPLPAAAPGAPGVGLMEMPVIPVPPLPANLPPPVLLPPEEPRYPGVILGIAIAQRRSTDPQTMEVSERYFLLPGDDVFIATVGASGMKPVSCTFTLADYFCAEMSEYDSSFVYVPLDELQQMRGMGDRVNTIQIKLKPEVANDTAFVHNVIIPELQKLMPVDGNVVSWQQHQGALLAAIDVERGILNVLLFLIVGVAGFSVLSIFTMIVSEKYRDIGVLKSLGASSLGVMRIFLGYGFLLGVVGCALGTALGLALTDNINAIEQLLARLTNQQIFDRKIYYFDKIPTNVEFDTVLLVNAGAVAIATAFSVLPAWRAARLHPVRALRFE